MQKNIIKFMILFTVVGLISQINTSTCLAATKYVKELWKNGGSGVWWNPGTWGNGFESVNVIDLQYKDNNGDIIIKHKVECYGNGVNSCPEMVVWQPTEPPSWLPNPSYLGDSYNMLLEYVYSQASNGVFSGNNSFNEIINNTMIYRNVIWSGDSTGAQINMNIFTLEY